MIARNMHEIDLKQSIMGLWVWLVLPLMVGQTLQAQTVGNTEFTYEIGIFNQYDLRTSSNNALAVHEFANDAFNRNIRSKMGEKSGNLAFGAFSFASTYMSMIWSHEFGHSLRAAQVGGHFHIHDASLPIPYTTMELPDSISLEDETLSVTGGFEVNYLNVRSIQRKFMKNNGASNVSLAFAFANRIMFPLYTSVIVPIDPEDPDVWINTAGDPVHVILPVFKNYSENQVFMSDGSVNPELVKFYQQAALLGSYFNLLDPQFYKEVAASFGDEKVDRKPVWLIGDEENGWTYGTLFNTSPLGYELYMNNYVNIDNNHFSVYLKFGRPFKNLGMGVVWDDVIHTETFSMNATVEAWDQDIYGAGIAAEVSSYVRMGQNLDLAIHTGYKTEGFVLGKQVSEGLNLGLGVRVNHD